MVKPRFLNNSDLFTWDEKYSVGIEEIDEQHKKFIAYINILNKIVVGKNSLSRIVTLFGELFEYTQNHFRLEEKLMSDNNYPFLEGHKKEHEFFIKELEKLYDKYNKKVYNISSETLIFLQKWLINHIIISDSKYKPYIKDNLA